MPSGGSPVFNDAGHGLLSWAPFLRRGPRERSHNIMKKEYRTLEVVAASSGTFDRLSAAVLST